MTNFDYTCKILPNICIVYARSDQFPNRTFCDTLNYSLHASKLITEGFNDTLNISINGDCITVETNDEEDIVECKYYRYNGNLPPNGWPQVNTSGLVRLTAFYPDILVISTATDGSD